MKILIIMPWIKPGGAELIAVQTAYQLSKRAHKVKLLALFKDVSSMSIEAEEIDYVVCGPQLASIFQKSRLFLYFFGPFFLFWLVLKQARWVDVLFPHSLPSYWIAAFWGKLLGKKVVWLCNEPPKWLSDSFLDRFFVRNIDQIIVYSKAIKKEVKKRYQRDGVLVRLGIDFHFFSKKSQKEEEKLARKFNLKDKFVLLMVGKLHHQKNQDLGIEVLAKVLPQIPQAVLILVGEGPEEKKLKVKSEKLKVSNEVIFAGFCPPKVVRTWYTVADLVLYPSVGQTTMVDQSWGFVPFEALCQKKLSIVSKNSGAAEVIEKEKIGFVCPVEVDCFAKKTFDYYQNRKKYQSMTKRGKKWVRDNLSWQKFGKDIEKVLIQILLTKTAKLFILRRRS